MQKSTFNLTKHELDFISEPVYMQMKQNLIRHVQAWFDALGMDLMQTYYPHVSGNHKVTRGENYLDMPYVVLDIPQLKADSLTGKLRLMFWWGHYISLQYFVTPDKAAALAAETQTLPLLLLVGDDIYENDLDKPGFIPLHQLSSSLNHASLTKVCMKVPFSEWENLTEHIQKFMLVVHQP